MVASENSVRVHTIYNTECTQPRLNALTAATNTVLCLIQERFDSAVSAASADEPPKMGNRQQLKSEVSRRIPVVRRWLSLPVCMCLFGTIYASIVASYDALQ